MGDIHLLGSNLNVTWLWSNNLQISHCDKAVFENLAGEPKCLMSIKCKTNFGSVLYFNKKETFEKYVLFTAEFTQMCFDLNDDERYKRFQFNFTVSAASHPSWTKWCIISCTDMCLGSSHIIGSLMLHHHPCAISILAVTSSSISSPPKFVFFSSLSSLCPLCPLAHPPASGACLIFC